MNKKETIGNIEVASRKKLRNENQTDIARFMAAESQQFLDNLDLVLSEAKKVLTDYDKIS